MVLTGVIHMKILFMGVAVLTVAGLFLVSGAAWSQEKEDVPARATWRPQAPERPELPPGVERQKEEFKVERPEINLPGFESEDDLEAEPEPEGAAAADAPSEVETQPDAGAGTPEPAAEPPPVTEPERETRVESPEAPAAVAVRAEDRADRTPPSPTSAIQPEYPRDALRQGQEGYVALEFTVTAEGEVTNVAITEAEPGGVFEEPVRDAIRRWRFQPATQGGEPVDQRVRHRFDFNLDE